ncbi:MULTISPECIES: porin [Variovorax]|jgi:predicted porin|uniref:porin n=1 Tax=Variovorax TaxID=34072 RepID=UPI00086A11C5|nr:MULTISPECIES: porin [Variovorax]MBN8754718.1 porin [Variovorax sp.]ODU19431.1 MAG: porin [Variovorax sp. SCN 67-85]ODV25332.1 MAG: porin [Variovorax sp. SCN 67-20]OJZ03150.1 MAG: porin [Variovorax sp. 67-131]UKI08239.1 porin [Variovorax paradoxus]
MRFFAMGLAAAGLAGAACAQSSVTLFGVVDAGISGYSNKSTDPKSATLANPFYRNQGSVTASQRVLSNSGLASSRVGFRGVEDLGGGLAASFWLESSITNDSGQEGIQSFARRSTVSLSGSFGEIRLGRDINATFTNDFVFDPLGVNGVGVNLLYRAGTAMSKMGVPQSAGVSPVLTNAYARSSNMVSYFLPPNLGGFYGQVQYAFNEKTQTSPGVLTPAATDTRSGRFVGGRFGYDRGPLNVALALSRNTLLSDYLTGTTLRQDTVNLGAAYDLGVAKLFGEVSRIKNRTIVTGLAASTASDLDLSGLMFGVNVPVGPGVIRASYAKVRYDYHRPFNTTPDPKARQLALSYVHNLSKRTALYASVARIDNRNGAALSVGGPSFVSGALVPSRSTGYDFGLRHAF